MDARMVHFEGSEEDGSYLLLFPGGEQLQVTADDVGRSRLLRDLLGSAVEAGEATLTYPLCVELSHLRTWAAAVQPDSVMLQEHADSMGKCLVVRLRPSFHTVRGWCLAHAFLWKAAGSSSRRHSYQWPVAGGGLLS